jgi:hypothetical protein
MECVEILGCGDVLTLSNSATAPIAAGGVKRMERAVMRGFNVTLSTALTPALSDFGDGVRALLDLNARPGGETVVVPLLGHCDNPQIMLTPFYSLGSADRLGGVISTAGYSQSDALLVRLTAAESYLDSLVVLHGHTAMDARPRVLCDAREGPGKLLSQFLVASPDGRLVLNDVDAAPATDTACRTPTGDPGVKCGHRQFSPADFVAPEMLWPHADKPFVDAGMHCYTEKIDIWRIPETLEYLVGPALRHHVGLPPSAAIAVYDRRLDALKQSCKARNPTLRPTAVDVRRRFRAMISPLRALAHADDQDFHLQAE